MAAHNGKVTVRSAEGAGSTFTLSLPLRGEQVGTDAALTLQTAESNSTGNAQEAPK
jgi:hypothetical protein